MIVPEHRSRRWLSTFIVGAVFVAITGPAAVVALVNRRIAETDRQLIALQCQNVVANIAQLKALAELEAELGLPVRFEIPEVSKACIGLLGH